MEHNNKLKTKIDLILNVIDYKQDAAQDKIYSLMRDVSCEFADWLPGFKKAEFSKSLDKGNWMEVKNRTTSYYFQYFIENIYKPI